MIPADLVKQYADDDIVRPKSRDVINWLMDKEKHKQKRALKCPGFDGEFDRPMPSEKDMNGVREDSQMAKNESVTDAMIRALKTALVNGDNRLNMMKIDFCFPGKYFGGSVCTFPVKGPMTLHTVGAIKVCMRTMTKNNKIQLKLQKACNDQSVRRAKEEL